MAWHCEFDVREWEWSVVVISSVVRLFGNFALVSDDVLKRECGSGESDRGGRGNRTED